MGDDRGGHAVGLMLADLPTHGLCFQGGQLVADDDAAAGLQAVAETDRAGDDAASAAPHVDPERLCAAWVFGVTDGFPCLGHGAFVGGGTA